MIEMTWIEFVIDHPRAEHVQSDGRIRRWAAIAESEGRWLRTIHNAFFDRGFTP